MIELLIVENRRTCASGGFGGGNLVRAVDITIVGMN
jgi:hypothetical protein